jgi:hypothetical protein
MVTAKLSAIIMNVRKQSEKKGDNVMNEAFAS